MDVLLLIGLMILVGCYLFAPGAPTPTRVRRHGYTSSYQDEFRHVRRQVLHRDQYRCQVCQRGGPGLHVHHIVYRSRGGTNAMSNLITLCPTCHRSVHARKRF